MTQTATIVLTTLVIESDLVAHIEDTIRVNAIRNGKLVEVYYNELTPEERRAAEAVVNHLYDYCG